MITLVLVDRADAEVVPALEGGTPLPRRLPELARVGGIISLVVIVAAVALVPTVTERLGRHVWPGLQPGDAERDGAPSSLQSSSQLDLACRPRLSNSVVFTVDAAHPDFWRGETFDEYLGKSWTNTRSGDPNNYLAHGDGTTVYVPAAEYDVGAQTGSSFRQTFHIEASFSDELFAAPSPRVVETDKLLSERPDGTLRVAPESGAGYGKGAVYTVYSRSLPVTEAHLAGGRQECGPRRDRRPVRADTRGHLRQSACARSHDYRRRDDDLRQGAGDRVVDGSEHAVLPQRTDIASSRRGRRLLVPEPAGLVRADREQSRRPRSQCRNPGPAGHRVRARARVTRLTGRFVVKEKDAHAWAEIYFAGVGWQGFDPTAAVPLAGDARSGGSWLADARHNAVPLAIAAVFIVLLAAATPEILAAAHRRRVRRASWSASALHRLERAGRKAGRARAPAETPREYARALAEELHDERLAALGDILDAELYSAHGREADGSRRRRRGANLASTVKGIL